MKTYPFLCVALLGMSLSVVAEEPSVTTPAYRGHPTVNGGECCQTLGEVRNHIDDVDRKIISLMAERQKYVHEAARFKANPMQVESPARVDAVLDKVSELAKQEGLSPEVARATYRAMINSFIAYEQKVFESSKNKQQ